MAPIFGLPRAATARTVVVRSAHALRVLGPNLPQLQVLDPVVPPVPVAVVDLLMGFKEPAHRPLHHETVLNDTAILPGGGMVRGVDVHVPPAGSLRVRGVTSLDPRPAGDNFGGGRSRRGRCQGVRPEHRQVVPAHEAPGEPTVDASLSGRGLGDARHCATPALAATVPGRDLGRNLKPVSSHVPNVLNGK